jgi:membrane protease YdiL (CAAX protease family)
VQQDFSGRETNATPPRVALCALYVLLLAGAEATLVLVDLQIGATLHALLVEGLLIQYLIATRGPAAAGNRHRTFRWLAPLLPTLMLVSLFRLVSLVMVSESIPVAYWYALIGVPALSGALLAVRLLGLSLDSLGLNSGESNWELGVALTGIPLGLVAYALLSPETITERDDVTSLLLASASIVVFSGFLEEFIFRGVVQAAGATVLGRAGWLWSSALFAVLYIGTESTPFAIYMAAVGAFFGWSVYRGASLWSVATAHSALNLGLLLIFPLAFSG